MFSSSMPYVYSIIDTSVQTACHNAHDIPHAMPHGFIIFFSFFFSSMSSRPKQSQTAHKACLLTPELPRSPSLSLALSGSVRFSWIICNLKLFSMFCVCVCVRVHVVRVQKPKAFEPWTQNKSKATVSMRIEQWKNSDKNTTKRRHKIAKKL